MSETGQVKMVREALIEQQSPCADAEAIDLDLDFKVSEEILANIEAGLIWEQMGARQCQLSSPFFS